MDLNIVEIIKNPSIIEWNVTRSSILIATVIAFGCIGIFIKCIFVKYILFHAPPNRPINSLILREQILRLISSVILISGNVVSLIKGQSIYEIFGHSGCFIFRFGFVLGLFAGYINSFCMALLRYLMIIHPIKLQKLGHQKVKQFVGITELLLYSWRGLWSLMAYFYTSSPFTATFCYDQSQTFLDTLTHHTHPTRNYLEKFSLTLNGISLQVMAILELLMYIRIFKTLMKNDINMKKSIGKDIFQMRTKRNIISLSGQAFGFATMLMTMIMLQIIVGMDSTLTGLQPQMTSFYVIIQGALLSVVELMTSPDMRKFFWKQ